MFIWREFFLILENILHKDLLQIKLSNCVCVGRGVYMYICGCHSPIEIGLLILNFSNDFLTVCSYTHQD